MKTIRTVATALTLAFPLSVFAAESPDASFYNDAAQGGMAEVELGKLANEKATSPDVKKYGAMMAKDHTAANAKLMGIAQRNSVMLPTSPSVSQMATKAKLEMMSGDSFDKSYVKSMVKDHQDTIALFEKEAMSGQDADAKAFAAATLPTLKAHLQKIQGIASAHGTAGE